MNMETGTRLIANLFDFGNDYFNDFNNDFDDDDDFDSDRPW